MTADELTHTLTKVRDEAHSLSKEKLAANEPKPARLKRAQELDAELLALQRDIDALPVTERAHQNGIVQVARRYLVFLLTEAAAAEPAGLEEKARALHNDVIAAAKLVAGGKLVDEARESSAAALKARFDALLAEPGPRGASEQGILADVNLDLGFIQQGGKAPTSLRLGRELR